MVGWLLPQRLLTVWLEGSTEEPKETHRVHCTLSAVAELVSRLRDVSKEVDVFIIHCVYLKDHRHKRPAVAVQRQSGVHGERAVHWRVYRVLLTHPKVLRWKLTSFNVSASSCCFFTVSDLVYSFEAYADSTTAAYLTLVQCNRIG